jgi:sugar lactone lactonase YvrE
MRKLFLLVFLLLLPLFAFPEGTRTWEQSKFDDLEKGTAKGVAIRSEGGLELAPSLKPIYTTPSTYIWAIAGDPQGNIYAAAGAPARVYRVMPSGQTSIIFQPQELQVQALVVDAGGALYAATSPDGKVYKIVPGSAPAAQASSEASARNAQQPDKAKVPVDAGYTSSVFFDPKTKYIWDLAEDAQGRIYVATGDQGEIFRVEKKGEHSLFFKSDEAHIRVLAFDPHGNLIAGSDGSGLVYRISPAGEAFVLYSAAKKEITALAIDKVGNIYAAGVGEKRGAALPGVVPHPTVTSSPTITVTTGPSAGAGMQIMPQTMPMNIPFPAMGATGGSEVYQIAPDGSPRRIWSSREDVVYSLAFDQRGQLLAGTGNRGRMYVIRDAGSFTDLVKASATQVTALAQAPNGGVYAATSNLGKIFTLGAAPDSDGTYESDVFDGHIFSRWGRAEVRGGGPFDVFARSGNVDNPDRNWSPWKKIDFAKGGELDVPPARFVQWKAVLHPGKPNPAISGVLINYLPKNVAPVMEEVFVQSGARFQSSPKPSGPENITVGSAPPPQRFESTTPAVRDRESIAVRWTAHDENDDEMVYSIFYLGDGETQWKLLKDNVTDKFYSFDASLLPDGGYAIRVVASDAPSHSPDEALSSAKESSRFEIDTTPPQVVNLNAAWDNNTLHITFRALDGFSPIKRAEYSIDAGEWQYVEPVGQLSDYRVENYDFLSALPGEPTKAATEVASAVPVRVKRGRRAAAAADPPIGAQEHVVVVRVYDRFENMGSAKFVVRGR